MPSVLTCEVFRIEKITPTPGAHSLETIEAFGLPCIVKKGAFKIGDLAVYIPENAIVPLDNPFFSFLKSPRIRPIKLLKGTVYSEGLVIPAPAEAKVGDDLREALRITKWEPDEPLDIHGKGERGPRTLRQKIKGFIFEKILGYGEGNEKDPGCMPVYGVENYRKYKGAFRIGERVVVTEKIHGMNFRAVYLPSPSTFRRLVAKVLLAAGFAYSASRVGGKLYVGSHERVKRRNRHNVFWKVAVDNGLDVKLAQHPGLVFFGEVFGDKVQKNYAYGAPQNKQYLRFFDIYDIACGPGRGYLPYDEFRKLTASLELDRAPLLYDGPFDPPKVEALRFGDACAYQRVGKRLVPITAGKVRPVGEDENVIGSFVQVVDGKILAAFHKDEVLVPGHIREGVVIATAEERRDDRLRRLKLKLVSEDYKIGNLDGTEFH
jgi:hypothetical protein